MKYTEDLIPRVFFDALTPKLKLLFEEILQEGMILTMVGGATRDFLLNGRVSKDIDLEIRMEIHLEEEEWKKTLFVLGQKLKNSYPVEFLPFGILRVLVGEYVVEFSSPRVEQYSEQGPWGHSDFTAKLSPSFCYEDSFKRRDFTINAIGFEFADLMDFKIQDPYRGIEDLKAGILRPCSDDFFKDPVRLLRLVRFAKKFNYRLAPSLEIHLNEFDLSKLKPFHFLSEAFKMGCTSFLTDFYALCDSKNVAVSSDILLLKEFLTNDFKNDSSKDLQELFVSKVFHASETHASEQLSSLAEKLGMKNNFIDQLYEFKKVLLAIDSYSVPLFISDLKVLVQRSDLENVLLQKPLQLMERFYFYERRLATLKPVFSSTLPKLYKDCIEQLTPFCSGEFKGEELFLELGRDHKISSDQKALLRLYTHLKQAIIT